MVSTCPPHQREMRSEMRCGAFVEIGRCVKCGEERVYPSPTWYGRDGAGGLVTRELARGYAAPSLGGVEIVEP
jgi:hypothetical protein